MNQQKLEQGEVVWAKLGRFPWWPALVKQQLTENEFEVEYLGDLSRSFLSVNKIQRFEDIPIPDKPSKALNQSIRNARNIIEGSLTRDQLFQQLTSVSIQNLKQMNKKIKIPSAKKKIKKNKQKSPKNFSKIQRSQSEIEPMSNIQFSKKLSQSFKIDNIQSIENEFKDFFNRIKSSLDFNDQFVQNLQVYEDNLDYFDSMEIYRSNIGVLIDKIITKLEFNKFENIKEKFEQLKNSITSKILKGFFEGKERSKGDSICSDAQTESQILCPKEDKNGSEESEEDRRVYFRVQKKLSKVLYLNIKSINKNFGKSDCEDCAKFMEKVIRKQKEKQQYKDAIIELIKNLEKNTRIIKKILENHKNKKFNKIKETIEVNIN